VTLSCSRCGGAVSLEDATERDVPDVRFEEDYRCVACGRTGRLQSLDDGSQRLLGCLA